MNALNVTSMFSAEAEQSVIGGLLLHPASFDLIGDVLAESDFYIEAHRLIYRQIALMLHQGRPVDAVTVADELDTAGESERSGGLVYLGEIASSTPGAANIRRYAELVRDKSLRRDLLAASAEVADLARQAGPETAAQRIEAAQERLIALSAKQRALREPEEIGASLPRMLEAIERRRERNGQVAGLRTGFADLDRITNGLHQGDLIIIAGRPSMGKSCLALNIAENVAMDAGSALIFSLEMSADQLSERSTASVGGISLSAIRSGELTEDDDARLSFALGKLHKAKLIIDDTTTPTIAQMRARARRVQRKFGLDLLVVDYIQLIGSTDFRKAGNRNEEIGQITRGLKLLARELGVPVIALSQLSRDVEKRPDKRPMMSDLRESGAIEQDADLILMAYRDEYYNPTGPFKGLAEILIRKHRQGELGDVRLAFQGEFARFRNVTSDAWDSAMRAAREASQAAKPMARRRIADD
ncbi:replicative DNA helicase [Dechloromonas sp. A34]|uniref:replicative DNA helicase n=1 Tax=Dechloromonas sp. A34 TaxID=447588 RepID=UPI0022493765|nr:replicative DNA helicase [Dechloromonas sp. A34]